MPVFWRIVRPPEVLAVPVGLGEISADHEAVFPESIEDLFGDIGARIFRERRIRTGDPVVRFFGVKHTEAVVVLGSEYHIAHTRRLGSFCPFLRVEVYRVESVLQVFISLLVTKEVCTVRAFAHYPIVRTNAPAFYFPPLSVGAPVHE